MAEQQHPNQLTSEDMIAVFDKVDSMNHKQLLFAHHYLLVLLKNKGMIE